MGTKDQGDNRGPGDLKEGEVIGGDGRVYSKDNPEVGKENPFAAGPGVNQQDEAYEAEQGGDPVPTSRKRTDKDT